MTLTRRVFLTTGTATAAMAAGTPGSRLRHAGNRAQCAIRIQPSRCSIRFARYRLGLAAVERLATGFRWSEGPVWFGDGRFLLWSDIPNNRMMKWEEETGGERLSQALE